jgi:glycosyltransferase involved in cell wall biosynthesis
MRVVWVSFAPLRKTPAGPSSDVASVRYRITLPAQSIPGSKVTHVGPGANRRTLLERFAGAEAAVFGKVNDASLAQSALELAAALRTRGIKVIADYSDDHFLHPVLGPAYRALANAADAVVAATPGLAEVLRAQTPVRVSVVSDPVEGERGEPRSELRRPPPLLWFGHPLNLDTLDSGLAQLAGRGIPFALTVMTAPGAGAERLGHRFRPWSTAALFEELRECDAVIIPSNPHDPRKAVKSPNRFTEALWAGRFVIAHPLPAYEALSAYGWVGEDLGQGLAWLLEHPDEARERIRAGQEWVARHASREAIGADWTAAIAAA